MTEIILEDDTQEKERQDIPLYVTAVFIAVSGIGLLIFTVYYIAFLPVPNAMQPLRVRVLTALQLEQALNEGLDIVMIKEGEGPVSLHQDPDEDSQIVGQLARGGFYQLLDHEDGWVELQDEQEIARGWVKEDHVSDIEEDSF